MREKVGEDLTMIRFYIPKELRTRFKTYVANKDKNMSEVIRELIEKEFNKNDH